MNLAVVWTPEAEETFDHIVNFIESRWGDAPAQKFVRTVHTTISTISAQPYIFIASYTTNTRKATITKQTSMFYEMHATYITILFFWDNRQEPIL